MSADRDRLAEPCPRCEKVGGRHGPGLAQCWHCPEPPVADACEHPCRRCGKPGGFYLDGLCWPCTGLRLTPDPMPAQPGWVRFRRRIIDALDGFVYVDANHCGAACPVCSIGRLNIFFHGTKPEADIGCSIGCDELEIAEALGIKARKVGT